MRPSLISALVTLAAGLVEPLQNLAEAIRKARERRIAQRMALERRRQAAQNRKRLESDARKKALQLGRK